MYQYWFISCENEPFFFKYFIYLFSERGKVRKKKRERNINVWVPLVHPQLET